MSQAEMDSQEYLIEETEDIVVKYETGQTGHLVWKHTDGSRDGPGFNLIDERRRCEKR